MKSKALLEEKALEQETNMLFDRCYKKGYALGMTICAGAVCLSAGTNEIYKGNYLTGSTCLALGVVIEFLAYRDHKNRRYK